MTKRSLKEAAESQKKLGVTCNHISGILRYWLEFIARGEHPTHSTFYDTEKEKLLHYVAEAISIFTEKKVIRISVVDEKLIEDMQRTVFERLNK